MTVKRKHRNVVVLIQTFFDVHECSYFLFTLKTIQKSEPAKCLKCYSCDNCSAAIQHEVHVFQKEQSEADQNEASIEDGAIVELML